MYLADDASGSNESFVASTSSNDLRLAIPAGTHAGGRSFLLVYCDNALGRATSGASVHFSDWAFSLPSTTGTGTTSAETTQTSSTSQGMVSTSTQADELGSENTFGNLSFIDLGAEAYQLNGTFAWTPPANTSEYLHYSVWLLTRKDYSTSVYEIFLTGSQVNDPSTPEGDVPLGKHELTFMQTRDLGSNGYAQYFAVIPNRKDNDTVMSFNEAGFLSIVDFPLMSLGALQVQSVTFSDEDSVATYIGGQVTWTRQDNVDYGFVEAWHCSSSTSLFFLRLFPGISLRGSGCWDLYNLGFWSG